MIRAWQERIQAGFREIGWPAMLGTLVLLSSGLYFLILSWGKWADILIDFGRELYIPWQISEGKVLYRDIYFYYGPVSKYFYAFFFKFFPPSLTLVTILNFLVLGVFVIVLFRLLRFWSSRAAAFLATGTFVALFAFAQYTGIGNYNFICPYSHELVHGLLLALLTLICFFKYVNGTGRSFSLIIGFLLGVVFLTKVEVFVALTGALGIGWGIGIYRLGKEKFFSIKDFLFVTFGFLLPCAAFYIYFISQMGFKFATQSFFFPYVAIFNTKLSANIFYKGLSGWDNPAESIRLILVSLGAIGALLVGVFLLVWLHARIVRHAVKISAGVCCLLAAAVAVWFAVTQYVPAYTIFRPLPIVSLLLLTVLGVRLFFVRPVKDRLTAYAMTVFAIFAMLLLLKISLYGHIFHSGFILALPAVMLVVVVVYDGGSALVQQIKGSRALFQGLFMLFLAGVVLSYGMIDVYYYKMKNFAFESSRGRILTYDARLSSNGPILMQALAYLQTLPKQATVAVLPEGVMLNFMSGHRSSTRYFEFSPSFFNMSSESDVLEAFRSAPSDYIVLVDRDMSEHGARYFGKDYAKDLFAWLAENYTPVKLFGNVPFSGKGFGVMIARRVMP